MDKDKTITQKGHFSLLRWRSDATRDEARNVAVILVEAEGQFGGVKAAPLSAISPRLQEQGLLDAIIQGLEKQLSGEHKLTLSDLQKMSESLQRSLYITQPQIVAVSDIDTTLSALYKAYVAPRGHYQPLTKGKVLDHVVGALRKRGINVRRGEYIDDFIFDVVIKKAKSPKPVVAEVLSFAPPNKTWLTAEKDAGYFLLALERLDATGFAVIQPPSQVSFSSARISYKRVSRWFESGNVQIVNPSELDTANLPI